MTTAQKVADRLAHQAFEHMAAQGLINRTVISEALYRELLVLQEAGVITFTAAATQEALMEVDKRQQAIMEARGQLEALGATSADLGDPRRIIGLRGLVEMIDEAIAAYAREYGAATERHHWLPALKPVRDEINAAIGKGAELAIDGMVRYGTQGVVCRFITARENLAVPMTHVELGSAQCVYRRKWETVVRAAINKGMEHVFPRGSA